MRYNPVACCWLEGTVVAGQNFTYRFDDIGNRTQTGGRASAVSTYTVNQLNQYTQRTVAGAVDVFGRVLPGVDVQVNDAEANLWEKPPPAGPWNYFHQVVSVDNSTAAQYPEITVKPKAYPKAATPLSRKLWDAGENLTQDGR